MFRLPASLWPARPLRAGSKLPHVLQKILHLTGGKRVRAAVQLLRIVLLEDLLEGCRAAVVQVRIGIVDAGHVRHVQINPSRGRANPRLPPAAGFWTSVAPYAA